jgi:hypothetical protein
MAEKLVVDVGFDAAHGHYVAHHPELKPFTALSLFGLRKKIEAALLPETVDIKLVLNRSARLRFTKLGTRWSRVFSLSRSSARHWLSALRKSTWPRKVAPSRRKAPHEGDGAE